MSYQVAPDKILPVDGQLVAGSPLVAPIVIADSYKVRQDILDGGVMTSDANGVLTLQAPTGGSGGGGIDGGFSDSVYGGTDPIEGGGA